jgi:SAM-dependent methyltransferase
MSSEKLTTSLQAWSSDRIVKDYVVSVGLRPPEVRMIAEAWPSILGGKILDIGVGAGRTVPYLSAFAAQYTAIDYAEGMVRACRQRFPEIRVQRGDARQLEFESGSFSFVMFSFNGIDYVHPDERERVLREIHRVMKPGGHFAFSTHNINFLHNRSLGFRAAWPAITMHPLRYGMRLLQACRSNVVALRNYRRFQSLEFIREKIAFVNDGSHEFAYLTCYIDHRAQAEDLERIGFEASALVLARDGRPIATDPTDPWLYFLVRRPAAD